jgi:hypothetical protein
LSGGVGAGDRGDGGRLVRNTGTSNDIVVFT